MVAAQLECEREEKRHVAEVSRIIDQWPEYRYHLACALLGSAVAIADSFGIDVEGWLAGLRRRHPRPPVLVLPKDGAS